MELFSMIDTVVNELKQDRDLTRIKKIIYCACEGRWENDESKLEEINLRELIEELYDKTGNIETLDHRLSRIVSKVNKKTEYGLLAKKIIDSVGRLYPDEEDVTIMESTPIWDLDNPQEQTVLKEKLAEEVYDQRDPGNLFDVREKILLGTNPLKAKILLFSTVEHKFNLSERDWLLLKKKSLDNLLKQIFNLCLSVTDLESLLYSAANNFQDPDENTQIANIIISSLIPCYEALEMSRGQIISTSESNSEQIEESEIVELDQKLNEVKKNNYLVAGEINSLAEKSSDIVTEEYNNQAREIEPISLSGSFEEKSSGNQTRKTVENTPEYFLDNDDQKSVSPQNIQPEPANKTNSVPAASANKNILNSIKQKLELEDEINILIEQKVNSVMNIIEEQFVDLEETLNKVLENRQEEEGLSLKYQALVAFIQNIQQKSSKFKQVMQQLEIEERKKLNLETSNNVAAQLELETNSLGENKQKILELAKQGNPKAISLIINQSLQQQGITAIAGIKNGRLHIILESDPIPNSEDMATFIQNKIANLQSESLTKVKIHGRKIGNKSIIWSKTIQL
ncbi:MAG: hypothetical protein QNJ68_01495 [Microcoleaceae cyanobacterium MO_207.B10]|nr:hypothetical protein [Microcoleaceae cyanobacterium MO_207.B10]